MTIACLVAAVFCLCMAGCGRRSSGSGITLRFSTWEAAGPGLEVIQKIVDRFEAEHPHIKVQIEQTPGAGYSGKILAQIASGSAPDVINISFYGDLPEYVKKGGLMCLEDYAKSDPQFHKSDYFPACINAASVDGKLYGVPKDANTLVMYYNKTLFEKAGIAYPTDKWTWDDLLAASRKLTQYKNGRITVLGGGYGPRSFYTLLLQMGGKMYDPQQKKSLLNDPKALEALKYASIFSKEKRIPLEDSTPGFTGMSYQDLFPMGKMAMWIFFPYRMGDVTTRTRSFDWDVAPIPVPKGGVRASELIHVGYAIAKSTKHPKESWELAKYLGGPVGQEMMAELKYGVPAIRSIAYSKKYGPPPAHIVYCAKALENASLFPTFPGSREFQEKSMVPLLQEVQYGTKTPEQALAEMSVALDTVLKDGSQ